MIKKNISTILALLCSCFLGLNAVLKDPVAVFTAATQVPEPQGGKALSETTFKFIPTKKGRGTARKLYADAFRVDAAAAAKALPEPPEGEDAIADATAQVMKTTGKTLIDQVADKGNANTKNLLAKLKADLA